MNNNWKWLKHTGLQNETECYICRSRGSNGNMFLNVKKKIYPKNAERYMK